MVQLAGIICAVIVTVLMMILFYAERVEPTHTFNEINQYTYIVTLKNGQMCTYSMKYKYSVFYHIGIGNCNIASSDGIILSCIFSIWMFIILGACIYATNNTEGYIYRHIKKVKHSS